MKSLTPPERIEKILEYLEITIDAFGKKINNGKRSQAVYDIMKGKTKDISNNMKNKIIECYPEISEIFLLAGAPPMLNEEITKKKTPSEKYIEEEEKKVKEPNLIPMYDDVSTFGSTNQNADLTAVSTPTEYIDAGTWFGNTKITAAIRHYGDSMVEYPNGCILALKEIRDRQNIIPGRNYVIETDEIRVTKRLQLCNDDNFFTAYSSNDETYPDGRQIHEPFKIKKKKINRVFLVVGRIVKEHSSGAVTILD